MDWVKNIVIYLLIVSIIMNLIGKSDYKKYINVFTGLLLLVIIITPIVNFISNENSLEQYFNAYVNKVELGIDLETIDVNENRKEEVILTTYKENVKKQISSLVQANGVYLKKCEIILDDKENFGVIKEIFCVIQYDEINDNDIFIEEVEHVNVVIDTTIEEIEQYEFSKNAEKYNELTQKLKNIIANFYAISSDNIYITVDY